MKLYVATASQIGLSASLHSVRQPPNPVAYNLTVAILPYTFSTFPTTPIHALPRMSDLQAAVHGNRSRYVLFPIQYPEVGICRMFSVLPSYGPH